MKYIQLIITYIRDKTQAGKAKELKSFTLVEMIVVMVISGLITTIIAGFFLIIIRTYHTRLKEYESNIQLLRLHSNVNEKLLTAPDVVITGEGTFLFNGNNIFTSEMENNNESYMVFQNDAFSDTLYLPVSDITFEYLYETGEEVSEINIGFDPFFNDSMKVNFYKQYSNRFLFEHEQNNK